MLKPVNVIAPRLTGISLPPLTRPAVRPDEEPTEELVFWAVNVYAYSCIAHLRTILDGLLQLAESGNGQMMFVIERHLYEWTMQSVYMLQKFRAFIGEGNLGDAWKLFDQVDNANGWIKKHGAKYAPEIPNDDMPDVIRIKHFVTAYEKHQTERGGESTANDDYGYLSEHSHPNGACFMPYREIREGAIHFAPAPEQHDIRGISHSAAADWLLTIYELLTLSKETAVRREITAVLADLAKQHIREAQDGKS